MCVPLLESSVLSIQLFKLALSIQWGLGYLLHFCFSVHFSPRALYTMEDQQEHTLKRLENSSMQALIEPLD
jgi:hypothetical protein